MNLQTECKCHGVSGSCTMKTCWKTLPPFRQIGDYVMIKYQRAKAVSPIQGKHAKKPLYLSLKKSRRPHRKPRRSELVYLHKSPNYCERDLSKGSLGTVGRKCNRTSKGEFLPGRNTTKQKCLYIFKFLIHSKGLLLFSGILSNNNKISEFSPVSRRYLDSNPVD